MTKISELAQKSSLGPDALDVAPVARPDAHPRHRPGGQAGADHRDDARDVQRLFADQVHDVGQRHRQRDLGAARDRRATAIRRRTAAPRRRRTPARRESVRRNAGSPAPRLGCVPLARIVDEMPNSTIAAASLSRLSPSSSRVRRGGAPSSRKIVDHRGRIGRRDDGAEQQPDRQRHPGQRQAEADRRGRREHRQDRQRQDRRGVLRDLAQIDRQRRVEQQQRQKDDQKDRRADRQIDDRPDDVVEARRSAACKAGKTKRRRPSRRRRRAARYTAPAGARPPAAQS